MLRGRRYKQPLLVVKHLSYECVTNAMYVWIKPLNSTVGDEGFEFRVEANALKEQSQLMRV